MTPFHACREKKGVCISSLASHNSTIVFLPRIFILFCFGTIIFLEEECGSGVEGKGAVVARTDESLLQCLCLMLVVGILGAVMLGARTLLFREAPLDLKACYSMV